MRPRAIPSVYSRCVEGFTRIPKPYHPFMHIKAHRLPEKHSRWLQRLGADMGEQGAMRQTPVIIQPILHKSPLQGIVGIQVCMEVLDGCNPQPWRTQNTYSSVVSLRLSIPNRNTNNAISFVLLRALEVDRIRTLRSEPHRNCLKHKEESQPALKICPTIKHCGPITILKQNVLLPYQCLP